MYRLTSSRDLPPAPLQDLAGNVCGQPTQPTRRRDIFRLSARVLRATIPRASKAAVPPLGSL